MPKKSLAAVLCLIFSLMLFSGCWGKSASSSSKAPSSSKPMTSSSAPMTSSVPSGSTSHSGSMSVSPSGTTSVPSTPAAPSVSSGASSKNTAAAPAAAALDANWELRLVNAENPLPENFTIKTLPISGYENRLFDARAASALENLLKDAQSAGRKLYLVSAYRSVARQDALFRRKVSSFIAEGFPAEEAEKQAAMWVARPGTSEHNLGLAADIVSANWYQTNSDLTESFDATPEFAWLSAHASEYGFVLRYPKNKKEITGVAYEPWHYRYVGNENAAMMQKTGATLEEYRAAR